MINQLIQVISQEAVLFEEFLDLLDRQKTMLVKNDVAGISRVTEQQREKIRESQRLNRVREDLLARIKEARSFDGDMTVARLAELADDNQAERLLKLREIILSLDVRINEVRDSNALLLNQSREFISRTMVMLSRINNPEATYGRGGQHPDGPSTVMVDRRI
ncbi:MAG: flagellar protein FlgN [candidate division Zixibacteria bacterium]|nr:flagellar protein FlgN [candidate division Zixibacteria bacterium]